jgi:hypothetical protein
MMYELLVPYLRSKLDDAICSPRSGFNHAEAIRSAPQGAPPKKRTIKWPVIISQCNGQIQ